MKPRDPFSRRKFLSASAAVAKSAPAQPQTQSDAFRQHNLAIWYRSAAAKWTDALPLGNGRLGAMFFGGFGVVAVEAGKRYVVLFSQAAPA